MDYRSVPPKEAFSLLNCGGIVLVCTRSEAGRYDLAPIAWSCPLDYEPTSRVLFVCDPAHATHENLLAKREFALDLPAFDQRDLVNAAVDEAWKKRLHYVSEAVSYAPGQKLG